MVNEIAVSNPRQNNAASVKPAVSMRERHASNADRRCRRIVAACAMIGSPTNVRMDHPQKGSTNTCEFVVAVQY
jgi:hypothetical protein